MRAAERYITVEEGEVSVQGVLHTEEKGDHGWMSSPKSLFRDWQRLASALDGMEEKDLLWGTRLSCLERSKGHSSSVNRRNHPDARM